MVEVVGAPPVVLLRATCVPRGPVLEERFWVRMTDTEGAPVPLAGVVPVPVVVVPLPVVPVVDAVFDDAVVVPEAPVVLEEPWGMQDWLTLETFASAGRDRLDTGVPDGSLRTNVNGAPPPVSCTEIVHVSMSAAAGIAAIPALTATAPAVAKAT